MSLAVCKLTVTPPKYCCFPSPARKRRQMPYLVVRRQLGQSGPFVKFTIHIIKPRLGLRVALPPIVCMFSPTLHTLHRSNNVL